MKRLWIARILWLVSLLTVVGCGGPEWSPPPDEGQQATQTRQLVLDFTASARKRPAQALQGVTILLESLTAYADTYGERYAELRDAATELQTLYQNKTPKADIDRQLDKLDQLANALTTSPGTDS